MHVYTCYCHTAAFVCSDETSEDFWETFPKLPKGTVLHSCLRAHSNATEVADHKILQEIKSPRTIRKDWVNLRASTGLKELKSDPVVKQNVFVFTLPINPSPSWLSGTCYFFPPNILSFSSHLADSRFLTESSYLLIAWGPSGDKCTPTTLPPVWYRHHTRTHTRLQSFTAVLPRATQGRRGNKGVHHLNSCKIEFRLCRGMFVSD